MTIETTPHRSYDAAGLAGNERFYKWIGTPCLFIKPFMGLTQYFNQLQTGETYVNYKANQQ